MAIFAQRFLGQRLVGFDKDMRICLTGHPSNSRSGPTHAYFPALMNCCGMLEYLAGFYRGNVDSCGVNEIIKYKKFLPQTDYSEDTIRVLFNAFRHRVAHHGIASGVWVDSYKATKGRRITWQISELDKRPAISIVEDAGVLEFDPPWVCGYTHRAHIHLDRLWRDIRDSVTAPGAYLDTLVSSPALLSKFEDCMQQLYPR